MSAIIHGLLSLPDGLACYMQAEVVHGLSGDEVSTRAVIHHCGVRT